MLSGPVFSRPPRTLVPRQYLYRFNGKFELRIHEGELDDEIANMLRDAEQLVCRDEYQYMLNYLMHAESRVNLTFLLLDRETEEVLSFAILKVRDDSPVATLSLICGKASKGAYYGWVVHALAAIYLIEDGKTEIALTASNRKNAQYYHYLGYRPARQDSSGRIIAQSVDGASMVLENIERSVLMKNFPEKLEKTMENHRAIPITGRLKQSDAWSNISRFFKHELKPTNGLDWKEWQLSYQRDDKIRYILDTSSWISYFELKPSSALKYGFAIAKEWNGIAEIYPIMDLIPINVKTADEGRPVLELSSVATLLLLRFLRKRGFAKAFTLDLENRGELLDMGFVVTDPPENVVVPTSRDFYMIDLANSDLQGITMDLVERSSSILEQFTDEDTTIGDLKED
jgi:hypothetical protein